jgi:hypothetical protein
MLSIDIASEYTKDKAKEIINGWEKEYLVMKWGYGLSQKIHLITL